MPPPPKIPTVKRSLNNRGERTWKLSNTHYFKKNSIRTKFKSSWNHDEKCWVFPYSDRWNTEEKIIDFYDTFRFDEGSPQYYEEIKEEKSSLRRKAKERLDRYATDRSFNLRRELSQIYELILHVESQSDGYGTTITCVAGKRHAVDRYINSTLPPGDIKYASLSDPGFCYKIHSFNTM